MQQPHALGADGWLVGGIVLHQRALVRLCRIYFAYPAQMVASLSLVSQSVKVAVTKVISNCPFITTTITLHMVVVIGRSIRVYRCRLD